MAHRLADLLRAAAAGRFPDADGEVEVVPPWRPGVEAVVAFTGHAVVATTLDAAALAAAGADGLGGASSPRVVDLLAGPDGASEPLDAVLVAAGTGRTELRERPDLAVLPRVVAARTWREHVHVHGDRRGVVTLAAGIGGLPELSFEVPEGLRGRGLGRSLVEDALGLVPPGEPVLASVAPGNARSLRALLAVGFRPVASVVLVRPGRR